ncbi:MAG: FHA domain-containing protein [Fuerstiella sp.]|nr:FHA domain-containing protein [Fuerstiella sp.]MCP4857126.1 FHA domain-containing protein [Fuerstiella sp.]
MVAVLQPVGEGKLIAIDRAVILVGRGTDCDVVISHSPKISRRHCCLVQVDESYFVRDLGSLNGVWLNGERINRESLMQGGDRVAIGDVEFLFHPNARVESKKAPSPVSDGFAPPRVAQVDGSEKLILPDSGDGLANKVNSKSELDDVPIIEVMDDVILLEDEADPTLKETNELEVIDEPIYDPEGDDFRDSEVFNNE